MTTWSKQLKFEKQLFQALTVLLVLAFAYLYAQGFAVKDQSFGSGLAYVLPAVVAMGLAIVTAVMALLTPSHQGE